MTQKNQTYDTPWKEIIEFFFPQFMAFFVPGSEGDINWGKEIKFLDKEFQKLTKESVLGQRHTDKLVEVTLLLDYQEKWAYLERQDNPFAIVVMAHLKALETRKDHSLRKQWKIELTRLLYEKGSGMCTGGRIVDHLEQGLNDAKNDLFFVGYQAKGTPGRRMMEKKIPVKAAIHTLSGYSAHADQNTLVNWVKSMPKPPGKIILVHGEPHAQKALAQRLGF